MEDSAFSMCFVMILMKWITDNRKCKCTTAGVYEIYRKFDILPTQHDTAALLKSSVDTVLSWI